MPASIFSALCSRFGEQLFHEQLTRDETPTIWTPQGKIIPVLEYLRSEADQPYRMLYDLTAIDERACKSKYNGTCEFTLVYHLFSFERNAFIRLKVVLRGEFPTTPASPISGRPPIGMKGKCTTCSASVSKGIPCFAAS